MLNQRSLVMAGLRYNFYGVNLMFKLIDIINSILFVVLPITMLSFVLPPLDYAIMGV
tara:strand:+ start:827 stop:997 length:171 start_codon:yes stop_codon:yes gene_type:complete